VKNYRKRDVTFWRNLVVLVLCCFLHGCERNRSVVVPVNPYVKAHFSYQPGSYWIYLDTVTNVVDCFYVKSYYVDTNTIAQNVKNTSYYYEEINVNIYTSSTPDSVPGYEMLLSGNRVDARSGVSTVYPYAQLYLYPYTSPAMISQEFYGYNISFFGKYNIGGTIYSNIEVNSWPYDTVYVSDSVGVVQMALNLPADSIHQVLTLQRYHVAKL
jgi:hypothetical protein